MSFSSYSDEALLEAIRKDSEPAFAELVKRYWKSVHNMVYSKVKSLDVTEEIVQNLFISIWDKRASLSIKNIPAYLHAATKNRVINYIHSQLTYRRHWEYYRQFIVQDENVTENDIQMNEIMEALECGINGLPAKSKKIFQLHQREGLSIAEIASSLNLSEKAIQYHLTQTTKRLRLHLKDYMLTAFVFLCVF